MFPFENLLSEKSFSHAIAYANSKLANLLFTFELNKRLERSGNSREIIAIANHPGFTECVHYAHYCHVVLRIIRDVIFDCHFHIAAKSSLRSFRV